MKTILFVLLAFVSLVSNAQENFKWDLIKESPKTKDELYSDTKMFIAESWKSAQNVIQNDDKENGVILIKGKSLQSLAYQMNNHNWIFAYTVKFYMKDKKYRIVIEDVFCESARCGIYDWPLMPVADNYPPQKGMKTTGVNEKRYKLLMSNLKEELQMLADNYQSYMEKTNNSNEDW